MVRSSAADCAFRRRCRAPTDRARCAAAARRRRYRSARCRRGRGSPACPPALPMRAACGRVRRRSPPAIPRPPPGPQSQQLRFRREWQRSTPWCLQNPDAPGRSLFNYGKNGYAATPRQAAIPRWIVEDRVDGPQAAHPVDTRFSQARYPVLRHLDPARAPGRVARHGRPPCRGAARRISRRCWSASSRAGFWSPRRSPTSWVAALR